MASTILTLTALGLALLPAAPAQAASDTWSTTGGSNNWNTGSDWSSGSVPLAGDSLVFGPQGTGGTTLTNDLTSGMWNIAGITFTSSAPAYTIGGNGFILGGSSGIANNSPFLQTINDTFSLAGTQTLATTAGGGNLLLGGALTGSGGISVAGGGVVTLATTNTYTGRLSSIRVAR